MIEKLKILLFVFLFHASVYSQTNNFDSLRCFKVADSIMLQHSNQLFFSRLIREPNVYRSEMVKLKSVYGINNLEDKEYCNKNKIVTYHVTYKIINDYNCHVIHKIGSMGPASVMVELDSNYYCTEVPPFLDEYIITNLRLMKVQPINKEKARLVAESYFSKKMKSKYWYSLFIYDTCNDLFYWRFEKEKGFRNVAQETVYINAENSEFVNKIENNFKQSFWQALF